MTALPSVIAPSLLSNPKLEYPDISSILLEALQENTLSKGMVVGIYRIALNIERFIDPELLKPRAP